MTNIFISYNHKSIDKVKTLAEDIEKLGHRVWYDQELSGGQVWWDHILEEIRKCDIFIFGLDNDSLDSAYCKNEYTYASDIGKSILPVLIQEGVSTGFLPPALSKLHIVNYCKQDREAIFRLNKALTSLPPVKPLPKILPPSPKVPTSLLGNLIEQLNMEGDLSFEKQSSILVNIKSLISNPKTKNHALKLLLKFRERRDVYANIAKELDELIATAKRLSSIDSNSEQHREQINTNSKKGKTDSGHGFWLPQLYKKLLLKVEIQKLKSRYRKFVGIDNVLAYYNSENTLRRSLTRVYQSKYPENKASKITRKMEERLANELNYMNRKRAAAILIMKELDIETMKAEGLIPFNWDFEVGIDPVILIRYAAKYCSKDSDRRQHLLRLLEEEFVLLKKSNPERHKELISNHKNELGALLTKEGELLVKLRLLMVIRGFDIKWLIEYGLITEQEMDMILRITYPKKVRRYGRFLVN